MHPIFLFYIYNTILVYFRQPSSPVELVQICSDYDSFQCLLAETVGEFWRVAEKSDGFTDVMVCFWQGFVLFFYLLYGKCMFFLYVIGVFGKKCGFSWIGNPLCFWHIIMRTYNTASLNNVTSNRTVSLRATLYRCKMFT